MSRKNKFDLTHMVKAGFLKDGETVMFVSDPAQNAKVTKQPNGEYKLTCGKGDEQQTLTVHACAQKFLGQEPPGHAAKWLRTQSGTTLYDLWQGENEEKMAA